MGKKTKLMLGDNIESLKKLPDNSIDSNRILNEKRL